MKKKLTRVIVLMIVSLMLIIPGSRTLADNLQRPDLICKPMDLWPFEYEND